MVKYPALRAELAKQPCWHCGKTPTVYHAVNSETGEYDLHLCFDDYMKVKDIIHKRTKS